MEQQGIPSRRSFLRMSGAGLLGIAATSLLNACQSASAPAPQPTTAPSVPAATANTAAAQTAPAAKPTTAAAPATVASPQPSAQAPAQGAGGPPALVGVTGAERDRLSALIEGAGKEGQVTLVDAVVVPATAVRMQETFRQRYGLPNFTVNHERLASGTLSARIREEVTAGKVLTDMFGVATPLFYYDLKNAGALMQYDSPQYQAYDTARKAGLTSEPGYWLAAFAYCLVPVANTKFYTKPIQSWKDLVAPELKGKFTFPNITGSETSLYTFVGLRKVLPLDYFKDVAQLALISSGSSVEETQKLASGELVISVTSNFRVRQTNAQTGTQLKAFYPDEGVTLLGQPYGILAKAPHPNAAKLFTDFIFSKEGQALYVELEGVISGRDDVTVSPEARQYSPLLSSLKPVPIDWKTLDNAALAQARQEWQSISGQ